jgi:hypothetical protein
MGQFSEIMVVDAMNIEQVKREIRELGRSPVAEKMYPITSDWVPITDVLAIINRYEKHWRQHAEASKSENEKRLVGEMFGHMQVSRD